MINAIVLLFGLIIVGYIANKRGILDDASNGRLSALLLRIALPCTILNSAFSNIDVDRKLIIDVTLAAVGVFILVPVISRLIAGKKGWNQTYRLMLNYSNLGFMGLPILNSLYGAKGVIYDAIFMMVFNLHIFTFGIITLQGKSGGFKELLKKMCNPGILSAIAAYIIVMVRIEAPAVLLNFVGSIGSITTPLAMMVIGSQLAEVDLRKSLSNKELYHMSIVKLVILPIAVYAVFRFILGDSVIADVAAILTGLPVAGNVTMLCSEYGGETSLAAEGTCVSTILSLGSIPMMLALIAL